MVRVSKEKAEENKAALIASADRMLREHGYDGFSTAAVAKAAGLTEGAIFRNFPTKADLAAAAVTAGFGPVLGLLASLEGRAGVRAYIENYLGPDHRDHFPWGCPVGALSSEMHRHPKPVQLAFTTGFEALVSELTRMTGTEVRAKTLLATLAGALGMARTLRASGNVESSDALLADVKAALLDAWDTPSD